MAEEVLSNPIDQLKNILSTIEPSATVTIHFAHQADVLTFTAKDLLSALVPPLAVPPEGEQATLVQPPAPSQSMRSPQPSSDGTANTVAKPEPLPGKTRQVYVTAESLRIRAAPSTSAPEVARLFRNAQLTLIDAAPVKTDGFSWQQLKDGRGWVAVEFTASADNGNAIPNSQGKPPTKSMTVATPSLRVRALPSVASPEVARLTLGKLLSVIDRPATVADGFSWVQLADATGWVANEFLKSASAPVPPTPFKMPILATQRGVGSSAGGWAPSDYELEIVHRSRIEHVMIVAYEAGQAQKAISRFRNAGVKHFIIRAAVHPPITNQPQEFIRRTIPILREYATALGSANEFLIALHNEVNLTEEGWGTVWRNGAEFANWYLQVAAAYRTAFHGCRIGFPALSPGEAIPNRRAEEGQFLLEARTAINDADWIGVHYYWQLPDGSDIDPPATQWRTWFGTKPIIATEVGPTDQVTVSAVAMRRAYQVFAQLGIPAVGFLLDGAGAWKNAEWTGNGIVI